MKLYGRPGVLLQTPYDEHFVGQLKTLPHRERIWFAHRLGWWVSEEHAALGRHFLLECFGVAVIVDDKGNETVHDHRTGETLEQGRLL